MSNPAVIILDNASSRNGKIKRFVLEDNIGEAIHLHIENMRVDFTINEFFEFSSMIRESLENLDFLCGYSLNDFDEHFLRECSDFLKDLVDIKIEKVKLSELKCIVHSNYRGNLNLLKILPLKEIPAYKYLKGAESEFLAYRQYNYSKVSNSDRLLNLLKSIEKKSYPYKNNYIVLFEGEDYIRDGQHRAAVLAHLQGLESEVEVMRFYFKSKNNLIKPLKNNIRNLLIWTAKKVIQKFRVKKIIKKILGRQ